MNIILWTLWERKSLQTFFTFIFSIDIDWFEKLNIDDPGLGLGLSWCWLSNWCTVVHLFVVVVIWWKWLLLGLVWSA